ncbi:hypothetical protein COCCADRAFT_112187, partial [Bipolaris zeicola 26-R-13]
FMTSSLLISKDSSFILMQLTLEALGIAGKGGESVDQSQRGQIALVARSVVLIFVYARYRRQM